MLHLKCIQLYKLILYFDTVQSSPKYNDYTNGYADLFLKFKDLRRKTKKLINSSYQQYLQSLSGKLQENPKHFWAFYSIKSKTKQIPETVIYGDTRSRDLNSKVELFNVFFYSVYSNSTKRLGN